MVYYIRKLDYIKNQFDRKEEYRNMEMMDYVIYSKELLRMNYNNRVSLVQGFLDEYQKKEYSNIYFIASGSSYNSILMVKDFLQSIVHKPIFIETPEHVVKFGILDEKNSFVVVVSQSGSSTNILESIDYLNRRNIFEITLTGNMNSRLAKHSNAVFDYHTGDEYIDFVTAGVQSLVLFLFLFGLAVRKVDDQYLYKKLDAMIDYQTKLVQTTTKFININLFRLSQNNPTVFCGDGGNFGVAREAALKFQETLKRPASYYELEEFLHGPDMSLTPNKMIYLLDDLVPSRRYWNVYKELSNAGLNVILITSKTHNPDSNILDINFIGPSEMGVFSTITPIQLIASTLMKLLKSERVHPFVEEFEKHIAIKSNDYESQLNLLKSRWVEKKEGKQ